MTETKRDLELSITEAAACAHVGRMAIYKAITIGRLKAHQVNTRWRISLEDLDMYRATKYRRDLREIDGEKVFDLENGKFSVLHVSKIISEALKRPYLPNKIYYLIRCGVVPVTRRGGQYVIQQKDAEELYQRECGEDPSQMRFA